MWATVDSPLQVDLHQRLCKLLTEWKYSHYAAVIVHCGVRSCLLFYVDLPESAEAPAEVSACGGDVIAGSRVEKTIMLNRYRDKKHNTEESKQTLRAAQQHLQGSSPLWVRPNHVGRSVLPSNGCQIKLIHICTAGILGLISATTVGG